MRYFNDIEVVVAASYPGYACTISTSPENYSLELLSGGKMYFQCNKGKRWVFSRPTLRWQAPGNFYNYGPVDEYGWEHHFVMFRGKRAVKLFNEGFARLSDDGFIPLHRPELFLALMSEIIELMKNPDVSSHWQAIVRLEEILLSAAQEVQMPESRDQHKVIIERVCRKISTKPDGEYAFRLIAVDAGLSESHFRKLFRQYTGIPPHQFLLRCRLKEAERRLREGGQSLKEIAFELKLGDSSQFSRSFQQVYGVPPSRYRRGYQ